LDIEYSVFKAPLGVWGNTKIAHLRSVVIILGIFAMHESGIGHYTA
jgi:hypothetical protein